MSVFVNGDNSTPLPPSSIVLLYRIKIREPFETSHMIDASNGIKTIFLNHVKILFFFIIELPPFRFF